jgi:hypothetical protein
LISESDDSNRQRSSRSVSVSYGASHANAKS